MDIFLLFLSQIKLVHIRSQFGWLFFRTRPVFLFICCRSRIYGLWNNLESVFNFVLAQFFPSFCVPFLLMFVRYRQQTHEERERPDANTQAVYWIFAVPDSERWCCCKQELCCICVLLAEWRQKTKEKRSEKKLKLQIKRVNKLLFSLENSSLFIVRLSTILWRTREFSLFAWY